MWGLWILDSRLIWVEWLNWALNGEHFIIPCASPTGSHIHILKQGPSVIQTKYKKKKTSPSHEHWEKCSAAVAHVVAGWLSYGEIYITRHNAQAEHRVPVCVSESRWKHISLPAFTAAPAEQHGAWLTHITARIQDHLYCIIISHQLFGFSLISSLLACSAPTVWRVKVGAELNLS